MLSWAAADACFLNVGRRLWPVKFSVTDWLATSGP